jgi:hypothetical protein
MKVIALVISLMSVDRRQIQIQTRTGGHQYDLPAGLGQYQYHTPQTVDWAEIPISIFLPIVCSSLLTH